MPRAGFEPAQNLTSELIELRYAVAISTTLWHQYGIRTFPKPETNDHQFFFQSRHVPYHNVILGAWGTAAILNLFKKFPEVSFKSQTEFP